MTLGIPRVRWWVEVSDPVGRHLFTSKDFNSIQATRVVNGLGSAVVLLPSSYSRPQLPTDGIVELWRQPAGGPAKLWGETIWFIRDPRQVINGRRRSWKLTCYDGNFLWGEPSGQKGRIVAYNTATANSAKVQAADNMMKAVIRENAGALATDTTRDLSAWLTVAGDVGAGPTIYQEFARQVILSVLQGIAQSSATDPTTPTYLAFDTVCSAPPSLGAFSLLFNTYTGQRGLDHRTSSNQQVLIGPDFGNLVNVELGEDSSQEGNYIYVGGQDVGIARPIATATDAARTGLSPFNRREMFVDGRNVGVNGAAGLTSIAVQALRANRARRVLTGELLDTDQARYDVKWGFGDYLTAQVSGFNFDCRVETITAEVSPGTPENIRASIRGEG